MAAPSPYNRLASFVQYALDHPTATYNPADHDSEFDAIELTLDAVVSNLGLIQRNDGKIANQTVHVDAFSTAALALMAATWVPSGLWLTATAYVVGSVVENSSVSYVCATAHTSGVFATDRAAGKWIVLGSAAGTTAASISFAPYSHVAAVTVQTALQEIIDEKALVGGASTQAFLAADATGKQNAATVGQIQRNALLHAVGAGTSDAVTATIASGETTLTDGMRVCVEATGANATTAPTLNLTLGSTATGAKTIKKGLGTSLTPGDIPGAEFKADLVYSSTLDCWLLMNPEPPEPAHQSELADRPDQRGRALHGQRGGAFNGPDGWSGNAVGAGVFKLRTLADPDNAALKCLEITCTTADAAIAAAIDYFLHRHRGLRRRRADGGHGLGAAITMQFKFKSNVNGVYGVSFRTARQSQLRRHDHRGRCERARIFGHAHDGHAGTWLYTNGKGCCSSARWRRELPDGGRRVGGRQLLARPARSATSCRTSPTSPT
jgi:hypothetical protein